MQSGAQSRESRAEPTGGRHGLFGGRTWAALAALAVLPVAVAGAELRVVGSDLLGVEFTKAFYGFAGQKGLGLALAFDGSRPGLEQLTAGRADLGIIVLPFEERDTLRAFETMPFGYQAVVVLAAASCPIERVTVAQLADVFGTGPGQEAPRWGQLGATGEWSTFPIGIAAPEVGQGIAIEFFRHAVLRGRDFRRNLARYGNDAELVSLLAPDSRVLALAATVPQGSGANLKPLAVAGEAAQPAVQASTETLQAGRYPLALAVQLVFRTEKRTTINPLAEFLFSEQASRLLQAAGIFPLPAHARAEQLRAIGLNEKPPN